MSRPRLLFVSPQFLLPPDQGGKIRTTNILKGMKGGAFEVHLVSPATEAEERKHSDELARLCDRYSSWRLPRSGVLSKVRRVAGLLTRLPISVWTDARPASRAAVRSFLRENDYDLAVVDFTHGAVIWPEDAGVPAVLFTHNVEAEIHQRHAELATGPMKAVWKREARTMKRFEDAAARRFDTVIGVSERDAEHFHTKVGVPYARPIPTGVDLDFFSFREPDSVSPSVPPRVVFTGSMNWRANQDGLLWFMRECWPKIVEAVPDVVFKGIGRHPPQSLIQAAKDAGVAWEFTGFVDDVRDHAGGAHAYVIPLHVGGGTRIKAYEAMAMGTPVVSTSLGIEGLPVKDGEHFLCADDAQGFADSVIKLLQDTEARNRIAKSARSYVEQNFGHEKVAKVFEEICLETLARASSARGVV